MKTTSQPEPAEVLISSAHYPANAYNTGAYTQEVYFDRGSRTFLAYAIQSGQIISQGAGRSEFAACCSLNTDLIARRDAIRAAA